MNRSLVLAGGGMRVAWQAGVLLALQDEGIAFDHVDGTSGGIMNTAMVLSGQRAEEMCERWSTVPVGKFSSALPLREYLGGPWSWPALGDADGILEVIFPHLGIDIDRVRESEIPGSFNVVEFTTKRCVAFSHPDVDAPLLAAGLSLPIFLPPLRRGADVWTDAVWIKDANLTEALDRGASEIWLIWCIGNSPYFGDGPLEQYVHMIEMSAAGGLGAEFTTAAAANREFVLHVVKPRYPLPLDPEFMAGRISADTLIDMGYRDACEYLAASSERGVAKDVGCTAMTDPPPSVRYDERLSGDVDGAELVLEWTIQSPLPGESGPTRWTGHIDYQPWGRRTPVAAGIVEVDGDTVHYKGRVRLHGAFVEVDARRELADDPGWDGWSDISRVQLSLDGAPVATLRLGPLELARTLASLEPVGARGLSDRVAAIVRSGHRGLRSMLLAR